MRMSDGPKRSGPPLPRSLAPFRDAIEATRLQFIAARPLPPTVAIEPLASRLGGAPWWPHREPYPTDIAGQPLYLLIQLNLAQTPPVPGFPGHGLLQLFVMADPRCVYGADVDNPAAPVGFACRYHADVTRPGAVYDKVPPPDPRHPLPLDDITQAIGLSLSLSSMTVTPSDYRFDSLLPAIAADDALSEAYFEWSRRDLPPIRLGGYPTFMQDDPRQLAPPPGLGEATLLCIETTDGITWGDGGAAQFLIADTDLHARDFRRVAYNWDCG